MSKKIKYLSILLIASLFFVGNVSAKTCKYQQGHNTYTVTYNKKGTVTKVIKKTDSQPKGVDSTKLYKDTFKGTLENGECTTKEIKIGKADNSVTAKQVPSKTKNTTNDNTSCPSFTNKKNCEQSTNPRCVWNSQYKLCSVNGNAYLSCGDAKDIPPIVPELISYAVNLLKIGTPIILIIVGLVELVKAVAASSEDAIKKAQSKLIKKVVAAVMVFFVIAIVQFVILKVADSSEVGGIQSCLKCFLNGTGDCDSIYVKDGYGQCYFKNGSSKACGEIAQSKK